MYCDLIGPVAGIGRRNRYVLTCIDGYSRFLATRVIPNKLAETVSSSLTDMFMKEVRIPHVVVADRGGEFTAIDTRAAMSILGIQNKFIPAGEHQLNLVERAHGTLWEALKAIRLSNSATTWQAAINQAVYSYNTAKHSTTGFTPQFLHNGQQVAAPGLI